MAKKSIEWDRIVEVRTGALRVVDGWEKPVMIWKSESEGITRFMWLVLNSTSKTGTVSKIYHTGKGLDTWEFAVISNYTAKLDYTANLLVWSLGLKEPSNIQYPQLYVMNPMDYMLKPYFRKEVHLGQFGQVVFSLTKEFGLVSFILSKDYSNLFKNDMLSYDEYMKFAKANGHDFEEILDSIDSLKDGIDSKLWDSMMF